MNVDIFRVPVDKHCQAIEMLRENIVSRRGMTADQTVEYCKSQVRDNKTALVVVAFDGPNIPVGLGICWVPFEMNHLWIDSVWIHPGPQYKDVGPAMMEIGITFAENLGLDEIRAETSRARPRSLFRKYEFLTISHILAKEL